MKVKPDDILAEQLGKLAAKAAKDDIGSGVVSWVANRLPTAVFRTTLQFNSSSESILRAAMRVFNSQGEVRDDVMHDSPNPTVSAVVGSGFLNMNPAVVTIEILADKESPTTTVHLFGSAKEGLIKQRAGEKAATKIAELLRNELD